MPPRYAALIAFLFSAGAHAQADISLQVGSHKYSASGQGECRHAPRASIYNIPAALYSVNHRGGTITLNAVAAGGEKISGKIQCRSFGGVHAEGG